MDEARAVLRRLRRIDALERAGAPACAVLEEVHELVDEAEAWLEVEGEEAPEAAEALMRCREALGATAAR